MGVGRFEVVCQKLFSQTKLRAWEFGCLLDPESDPTNLAELSPFILTSLTVTFFDSSKKQALSN
jgi:hypothetical protein